MDRNQHYRTGKERRTPPPSRMYDQDRRGQPPRRKSGMKQVVLPLGSLQSPPEDDRQARRVSPQRRAAAQKRRITKGEMRRRRRRLKALTTLMVIMLVAAGTVEEACVLALQFERAARMQLLAMAAGKIQPIPPALGHEAHDWILTPKRSQVGFSYYARRALRQHPDVLA